MIFLCTAVFFCRFLAEVSWRWSRRLCLRLRLFSAMCLDLFTITGVRAVRSLSVRSLDCLARVRGDEKGGYGSRILVGTSGVDLISMQTTLRRLRYSDLDA